MTCTNINFNMHIEPDLEPDTNTYDIISMHNYYREPGTSWMALTHNYRPRSSQYVCASMQYIGLKGMV